jgi:hypothetical protein
MRMIFWPLAAETLHARANEAFALNLNLMAMKDTTT